ncbi:hypothetical protein FF38_12303, partial [Lucilia cuprina]
MIGLSALRLRLPHPVRWLVAVCFAAAVIVGLMGMHTIFSGHTAPTTSENVEMPGGAPHHSSAPATGDEDAEARPRAAGPPRRMVVCVGAACIASAGDAVPAGPGPASLTPGAVDQPNVTRTVPALWGGVFERTDDEQEDAFGSGRGRTAGSGA